MLIASAAALFVLQDPDLAAVRASEARRTAVIAACAPAVCAVMAMDQPGGGSGVIIDPAGFVLTNYHVVGEPDRDYRLPEPPAPPAEALAAWRAANQAADAAAEPAFVRQWQAEWRREHQAQGKFHYRDKKVGLPDGELYAAEVLGIDPGSDLAVLRLVPKHPGQTWPFRPLGDSDRVLVGQTVFAMGNPFLLATDFTPTVTFGIVSGTHRYQEGQGQRMLVYPDCIQVDAPVNPGNSGGPLFDETGAVIGINGRIAVGARGRVNVGVGFAIASNQIQNFLGDLLAGRHAEHGTLDMSAWFMNAREGDRNRRGVYVQQMFRDSVVAAAGVGLGDEIVHFNGIEVRSANQLATLVGVLPAGTLVEFGYRPLAEGGSFGEERSVTVRLTPLDTGSSRETGAETRLASRANQRLAAAALRRRWTHVPPPVAPGLSLRDPQGGVHQSLRQGADVVLRLADRELRSAAAGGGVVREVGQNRPANADELARLQRERAANPWLFGAAELDQHLAQAELLGGVHVLGAPAHRFGLPGEGDPELWFFADGSPAGFAFRDPLRRARLEFHVRGPRVRCVVDGALAPGWSRADGEEAPR